MLRNDKCQHDCTGIPQGIHLGKQGSLRTLEKQNFQSVPGNSKSSCCVLQHWRIEVFNLTWIRGMAVVRPITVSTALEEKNMQEERMSYWENVLGKNLLSRKKKKKKMFKRYFEFLKLLFLIVIWYCLVVPNHEYCTRSSLKTVPTPKVLFAYHSEAFSATFWSEKCDSFRLLGKKYCNWCWCWIWDSTLHSPSTLQQWFNVCRHHSDLLSFFTYVRHQSSSWGAVVNKKKNGLSAFTHVGILNLASLKSKPFLSICLKQQHHIKLLPLSHVAQCSCISFSRRA